MLCGRGASRASGVHGATAALMSSTRITSRIKASIFLDGSRRVEEAYSSCSGKLLSMRLKHWVFL